MALQSILFAPATITGNGASSPATTLPVNTRGAIFNINVTAADGTTPALSLSLQWFDPAANKWIVLATLPNITTPGNTTKVVYPGAASTIYDVLPGNYRWAWTLTGEGAAFTFSIGVNYLN